MIDAEVLRLRKLRNVSLRARALAKHLSAEGGAQRSVFAESALLCWTIARLATGQLRAHPYPSYQKGPSKLRAFADRLLAFHTSRGNRRARVFAQQWQSVAREVNDVRSLTWSADLSDALGRAQKQMRRLTNEIELAALVEAGAPAMPNSNALVGSQTRTAMDEISVESNWPYLAI